MKKAFGVCLWATIFLLSWAMVPSLSGAADLSSVAGGIRTGILFEMPDYPRLLRELETCSSIREENTVLRSLNEKNEQLDEIRKEREALLRERIAFLEAQQGELLKMNEAAIRTADLARKAGGGSLWEKALTAGKWIGLGVALGFLGSAGR